MKRIFLVLFSTVVMISVSAAVKSSVPDFAFPKQVIKNAENNLNAALKNGDGIQALRALMDFSLAESAISEENLPVVFEKIAFIREKETSPIIKSLLDLLTARIYFDIYNEDKYKYDSRVINADNSDYRDWSGNQFKDKIQSLINAALAEKEVLIQSAITDYSSIITIDGNSVVYYPTLYDFVAGQSINMLKSISSFSNSLPIILLTSQSEFISAPRYVFSSATASHVLDIYAALLALHADDVPALINVEIERINLISRNCYNTFHEAANVKRGELLKELYQKYNFNQYSGDILLELSSDYYSGQKEYYNELKNFSLKFPGYYRVGCITDRMASMTRPSLTVIVPEIISPNNYVPVKLKVDNLCDFTLSVYRLPKSHSAFDETYSVDNIKALSLPVVSKCNIKISQSAPFLCDTVIGITVPEYGNYIVVPEWDNRNSQRRQYFNIMHCTDLVTGEMSLKSSDIFVVNPLTGAPVDGVTLKLRSYTSTPRQTKITDIGVTDILGFSSVKKNISGNLLAIKGEDKYSAPIWINRYENHIDKRRYVYASTDLPIYHPGDSMRWLSVIYTSEGEKHNLLTGVKQRAILYNANYLAIDTLDGVTDMYGRMSGEFLLPSDELTGQFHIEFPETDYSSTIYFTVSDYKMPTIRFNDEKALSGVPSNGDVSVKGKLMTYTGLPMKNATVKLSLSASMYSFWRRSNSVHFFNDSVVTDADGVFLFILKKELLDNSPAPEGLFTAQLSATSLSGENITSDVTFVRSKKYNLEASSPQAVDISDIIQFSARIIDSDNQTVKAKGIIAFKQKDREWVNYEVNLPNPSLNLKKLPSGMYNIKVYSTDILTDTVDIKNVIFYRPTDKKSPSDKALWCPNNYAEYETDSSGAYKILYGTTGEHTHILFTLSDSANIYERRWLDVKAGMHRLDVRLPKGIRKANILLMSVKDYNEETYSSTLINKSLFNDIRISAESFRDKLIPGNEETWVFRTVDKNGDGVESAFIMNMYNEALNSLATAQSLFVPENFYPSKLSLTLPSMGTRNMYFADNNMRYTNCLNRYSLPDFNTYGRGFSSGYGSVMVYDAVNQLSSPTMGLYAANSLKQLRIRGTTMMKMNDMAEAEEEDGIMEEYVAASSSDAGSAESDNGSDSKFDFRESNVPLAFFAPMLRTDSSGLLEFRFKVPNANTTWKFNATAYTQDVDVANFASSVLANKPVMVQPNLPRYLRVGDKARIEAIVTNNSDSISTIPVNITTFNPSDNAVISSVDTILTDVAAHAMVSINSVIDVKDIPMLGYRIKAATDLFADGEQSVIPVLSTVLPVIDTHPFYISPDCDSVDLIVKLPVDSANVTLQYCDNPAWYVITALPGLSDNENATSPQIASALYSAAMARGLMKKYPQISAALREWSRSDKTDSTLISMLERNESIKNILLKATIWQRDAMSDTERMQRLVLLLSNENIDKSIKESIAKLKKLIRDGGGWAWSSYNNEVSEWATYSVLSLLGKLNVSEFLPEDKDLNAMVESALAYHQKIVEKNYSKYPKGDYTSYTELRDLWTQYTPSHIGNKIIAANVQMLLKKWKSMTISAKAGTAMILARHGYPTMAKQVLKSIDEYAVSSPSKGMYWPSVSESNSGITELAVTTKALMAYYVVTPDAKEIDAIRQWLILQKEARNWGESSVTNDVIASILIASSTWLDTDNEFSITYNGSSMDVSSADYALGYINNNVSEISRNTNSLTIKTGGGHPAWGSLCAAYRQNNLEIAASGCEDLSISRSYYRFVDGKWVESTDFNVGDRVKVLLKVVANKTLQYVT
ncbi:MAG: hypothetical protein K2M94_05600, partial [Paramuribaculum sp.]|nr:hypothetical protein [Paramuribaculum sp.]